VGIDWYGVQMFRTGDYAREANKKRNKIEKICEAFDLAIDDLQNVHSYDSKGDKFFFPIKLEKSTKNNIFAYITSRLKHEPKNEKIVFKL
jgi:hypothetical protein